MLGITAVHLPQALQRPSRQAHLRELVCVSSKERETRCRYRSQRRRVTSLRAMRTVVELACPGA